MSPPLFSFCWSSPSSSLGGPSQLLLPQHQLVSLRWTSEHMYSQMISWWYWLLLLLCKQLWQSSSRCGSSLKSFALLCLLYAQLVAVSKVCGSSFVFFPFLVCLVYHLISGLHSCVKQRVDSTNRENL